MADSAARHGFRSAPQALLALDTFPTGFAPSLGWFTDVDHVLLPDWNDFPQVLHSDVEKERQRLQSRT